MQLIWIIPNQPLQPVRDELKSYVRRHNLTELGDAVRELFENYNISDTSEQLQVSEICSQVPAEGSRSSDDEVRSTSSVTGSRKLNPKSLNNNLGQASPCTESAKETSPKNNPVTRTKRSLNNKTSANSRSVSEMGGRKFQKKAEKITKPESNKEKERNRKHGKKSATEEGKSTDI